MKPFFSNDERIAKLLLQAGKWVGTPWCANSQAQGERGGVACHNLPRAILMQCGALAQDFPVIRGDPTGTQHKRESVMVKFLDERREFERVDLGRERLVPGDLVGLRICRCVDHLGVVLKDNAFIHVLMHKRTDLDFTNVPPWQQRIEAAWRPIEL